MNSAVSKMAEPTARLDVNLLIPEAGRVPSDSPSSRPFSSASALETLRAACPIAGLSADGAKLLRFGSNAIYRVHDVPVVVRIARDADQLPRITKELLTARWLAEHNYPTVQVAEAFEQPLLVDGRPVSFWVAIDEVEPVPTVADLAVLLRTLHQLPPPSFEVPVYWPFGKIRRRLQLAEKVPEDARAFLYQRCREVEAQYRDLEFDLPGGVIHGDAHRGNLMRRGDGVVVLGDFEEVSIGPREWDLTPTAVNLVRFSLPEAAYRQFVDGYGFDVMGWDGFGVLQRMRELTATSWLMQNVNESPVIAEEFDLRVASMQGAPMRRPWQPF